MANSKDQQVDELEDEMNKFEIEYESTPSTSISYIEPVLEEEFFAYFENFIFKSIDGYHCNLCGKDFVSVSSIMEHLNDQKHVNLVVNKTQNQDLDDDFVITPDLCKILVKNNIFKHDSLLKCYSCELILESDIFIQDHIDSLDHKLQSNEFGKVQKYTGASENVGTTPKKNDYLTLHQLLPLLDLKDDFVKYFDNFIEKHGDDYLCHLCHVKLLSMPAVLSHMEQQYHHNLVTRKESENNIRPQCQGDPNRCKLLVQSGIFPLGSYFWCDACQCILESYIDAKNHSRKLKHQEKLDRHFDSSKKENKELLVSEKNKKDNEEVIVQKYPNYIYFDYKDDDEKMLTCSICFCTQLWIKHKDTLEHTFRKSFFLDNFTDTPGNYVLCLRCKTTISKSSIFYHASKEHQLIPWYRPPDEFIIYFKNFIQPMDRKYYCYLCKEVILSWYLAINHIEVIKHSECSKRPILEIDVYQQTSKSDFCETMSTNGIFPFNITQLRCWICLSIVDRYTVFRHIEGNKHQTLLKEKLSRSCEAATDQESTVDVETLLVPDQESTVAVETPSVTDQESTITQSVTDEKHTEAVGTSSNTDEESTITLEAQSVPIQEDIVLGSRFKTAEDEC